MAVKVLIPPPLRPHAGGQVAAEVPARNVAEALDRLTSEFADLKRHLFTEEGRLRSFVNVYVNGEDIRYLAQEKTPTKDGDTINIIPSIAGGISLGKACQDAKIAERTLDRAARGALGLRDSGIALA